MCEYHRSGFNCEVLIIANCELLAATQLLNCANVALLIRFNLLSVTNARKANTVRVHKRNY